MTHAKTDGLDIAPQAIRAYHLQKAIPPSPFENRVMVSTKQTVPTTPASAPARSGSHDWIRPAAFLAALVILVAATVWMHIQAPPPDPFRPAKTFSMQWWLSPIERNGFMRLPLVGGDPAKLFVLPGSTHAWVGGLLWQRLLHSSDRGTTWEVITVSAGQARPGATPRAAQNESVGQRGSFELISSAYTNIPSLFEQTTSRSVLVSDFCFVDALHGWVLDLNGQILETRNGGKSWSSRPLPNPPLTAYFALAVSASRLVAGGFEVVSFSNDRGSTWKSARINDTDVRALDIAPDGHIWAAADGGGIWSSIDASEWQRVGTVNYKKPNLPTGIQFEDARHGFIQLRHGYAETIDGGRTWAQRVRPILGGTITFSKSGRRGYSMARSVVVGLPNARIPVNDEYVARINTAEGFGDHKHAIALGQHGQIFVTSGDGAWGRATAPGGFVQALHADTDGKRLWTVGHAGTMLHSLDGGATWESLYSGTTADLVAITLAAGGTNGWAVSRDGVVTYTEDGGENWIARYLFTDARGFHPDESVLASDDGVHVVVGMARSANYYESNDGGKTGWKEVASSEPFLASGFFATASDQWIVEEGLRDNRTARFIRRSPRGVIQSTIPASAREITAIGENGWVAFNSLPTYRTRDGGRTWQPTNAPQVEMIYSFCFLNANHGFAETPDNRKFETSDGGMSWQPMPPDPTSWRVGPLVANKDGKHMWTASIDGVPLRSIDGGKHWLAPEYRRYPAPWYYLTFAPVGLLLLVAMRKPSPKQANHSIEDVPWNDKPLTDPAGDRLDYGPLASGIARFFGNPRTEPPLTIAITGPWGSGKSSLMSLVAAAVKRYDYRPVWFNAWHYQSEEYLLPAVLESIRTEAVPRWWTWGGLQFRMRLLLLRGMKNWLPALAIMAALVTTAVYFSQQPEAFRQFVNNLKDLGAQESDTFLQSFGLVISSLISIIVVARSLNAFGVSGTKLTAILTGSVRLADAGGQTGFRHRFARAFGEVTRALGRNRLVLFIDDLDRCRPDHVLSVLECINFLVTSGDCFIIAGMDRPRVERCVAMRFDEESRAIGADENSDGENDPVTPVRYAQLYLEKLINIEVPVPHAAPERSRDLFANLKRTDDEEHVRTTAFGHRIAAFVQATIPWAVGISVIAGAAFVGYTVLPNRLKPPPPPQQQQPKVVSTPATASKLAPPGPPVPNPRDNKPPQAEAQAGSPARFVVPAQTTNREVLPIAGIILVVAFGIIRLSLERAKLEQDSDDFRTALRLWHPLLYYTGATPRSMKRCVNRVRYYAMRQRTNPLPPTLPERLARLLQRVLRRPRAADDDVALEIPERVLVPVSVVQDRFPSWLEDDVFWLDPATYVESRCPIAKLADGIAALRVCGSIERYREAFNRISAGIRVAGVAKDGAATARTATS